MTTTQRKFSIKYLLWAILLLIVLCVGSIVAILSTDKGTKFFFERMLSQQNKITYQYVGGNLWQGIDLNHFNLDLDTTQIKADEVNIHLGWRAILAKEAHFFQSDIKNLQIINSKPSDNEPFSYPELKLPITLRFNQLNVDKLTIQTIQSKTEIHNIELNDALWKGTHLEFSDSTLDLYNIYISQATGNIDFTGKYPLQLNAQVHIPSVAKSLNMQNITVSADGTLAEIRAGVATQTPDLLTGWIVLEPMTQLVPMKGQLNFKQYHLPFLQEQKLFVEQGVADFSGNYQGFDIELKTDLKAKDIAKGQYTAKMYTNFTDKLNIHYLTADIYDGQIQLNNGELNWSDTQNLKWKTQATFDGIKIPEQLLANNIQQFLPKKMSGEVYSTGSFKDSVITQNQIRFSNNEQWNVQYKQASPQVHIVDVAWNNINREFPYITGLTSQQGNAQVVLANDYQDVDFKTHIQHYDGSFLPTGNYQGHLTLKNNVLNVSRFNYQQHNAQVNGTAQVLLPTDKQALHWSADLDLKNFNPQLINNAVPVDMVNGQVRVSGYQKGDAQIIQTQNMSLQGKLANQYANKDLNLEWVNLTGDATTALIFNDEQQGGGLKSFAVNYDGEFKGLKQANGVLQFKISGTPAFIHVEQLYHNGIAGQMQAQGKVDLSQGVKWDLKTSLVHFKPQYFHASVNGDISGVIHSRGEWTDQNKAIKVDDLDIAGTLNGKALRGVGQLSVDLNHLDKGLAQQQFQANNLHLSYANNQVQVTGNQKTLLVKINAGALNQIVSDLQGRIYGQLSLERQKRLQVHSNLVIDQLKYGDLMQVQKLTLQGELPISDTVPSQLVLNIRDVSLFNRRIETAKMSLVGTYLTHVLKLESQHPRSDFSVQVAGGFNKSRWLGQIQQGKYISKRMQLLQNRNADIVYDLNKKSLVIAKHCWNNKNNQICFDEDISASPEHAQLSLMTKNVYIQDLGEFIPDDMEITGQLNGYAKASWQKGKQPQIDAQLFTRNGTIGLTAEDESSTTLQYDELSTIVKSTNNGLLLHTNVKTPEIGTGFAKVLIQPEIKGMPMKGEVAFDDVKLAVFRPFINDVRQMSGSLSVAGKIDGYLTEPEFVGEVRVKDGVFSLISLPVDLNNIQLYSHIRQNRADISGSFNSGKGEARITGQAGWNQSPYLRLKVKGNNLVVRQAPQIMANVNPDLSFELLPTKRQISLNGSIFIPRALITMPENRASAVEVSSDVRVVRKSQQEQQLALNKAKAWDIQANIDLKLGEQIIFQGFDARIPMAGSLKLTQRGTELAMRAKGAIGITQKVPISAYGQTVDLSRAIARFDGLLLNPSLDIDAVKSVQGSNVGVRVLGTALNPEIKIYSDAGLSEQEALNALLTGRISDGSSSVTTDSFKSDVNNAVAAAGISMGLGGTRALTNQIGRAFGLSGLALDAQGNGNDTQISLTGYITPDLYIRYGVGVFTPVNKLTLRYQINRRLYLEASQDLERAIDLFYNWKF